MYKVTMYQTSDGQIFKTVEEAKEEERMIPLRRKLSKLAPAFMKGTKRKALVEWVIDNAKDLLEILEPLDERPYSRPQLLAAKVETAIKRSTEREDG